MNIHIFGSEEQRLRAIYDGSVETYNNLAWADSCSDDLPEIRFLMDPEFGRSFLDKSTGQTFVITDESWLSFHPVVCVPIDDCRPRGPQVRKLYLRRKMPFDPRLVKVA